MEDEPVAPVQLCQLLLERLQEKLQRPAGPIWIFSEIAEPNKTSLKATALLHFLSNTGTLFQPPKMHYCSPVEFGYVQKAQIPNPF
jgi:hypothetical protein